MDLGIDFNSSNESKQLEVLNNLQDPKNINMKTRVNLDQIKAFSYQYHLMLCEETQTIVDKTGRLIIRSKYDASTAFNMTMSLIKELLVSKDDINNRTLKIVDGIKGMNNTRIEQSGMGMMPGMK